MSIVDLQTELRGLSPSFVVELSSAGLAVPKYRRKPEITLSLPDLHVLEHLARGVPPTDLERDEGAAELLRALDTRRLLAAGDVTPSVETHLPDESTLVSPTRTHAKPDEVLYWPIPLLIGVQAEGFEVVAHDGRVLARLGADELFAMATFRAPSTVDGAFTVYRDAVGDRALDRSTFDRLVERLVDVRVLTSFDPMAPAVVRESQAAERMRDAIRRRALVNKEFDRIEAQHDAAGGPPGRTRVIGFHTNFAGPPQSLGLLIAAANAHDDGALQRRYDFRPRLVWDRERLTEAAQAGPAIYLFSNYVWTTAENLAHSQLVKSIEPRSLTIHGGPDTPKYPDDVARWFAANPHVDICVHGEGEETFVDLLAALPPLDADGPPDLSVLDDVAGLSYRTADGCKQTGKRDRVADLDTLPSPILTGLFDGFIPAGKGEAGVIIETNRGCPYGCTFCDWGSATLSRIRKFDIDRVFAEIEWCAVHGFGIGLADANFGIFERDVDIAEHIARLKSQYGWPKAVGNNYAKNTVKHLSKIIDVFTAAGIVAEGKMSMQTFDTDTLLTIRRKNIKVEKYGELSVEFRRNDLPLAVELMMGLPGATFDAFADDLQACIDRDVRATIFPTVLLPNSPMNDPTYREEHQIVAKPGEYVTSSSSYTPADYQAMKRLRFAFYVFENFGVLRQVATFVRSETGIRQIDFYMGLINDVDRDPHRWPMLTVAVEVLPLKMLPPVSWQRFIEDVRSYLVDRIGMVEDSALETVLEVQHALLPARGRSFPVELSLKHDYASWHMLAVAAQSQAAQGQGANVAPRLIEMSPATFTIDDPLASCESSFGYPCDSFLYFESSWDLSSPVSRPRQALPQT
jgi:hypothetical protein